MGRESSFCSRSALGGSANQAGTYRFTELGLLHIPPSSVNWNTSHAIRQFGGTGHCTTKQHLLDKQCQHKSGGTEQEYLPDSNVTAIVMACLLICAIISSRAYAYIQPRLAYAPMTQRPF